VLSLALGIGSCVAAFRLIDALLWRPLPISNADRLYVLSRKMIGLYGKPIEDGHWATPDFNLMRDAVKDQADLIAISDADRTDITWSTDDDMEKAHVVYASGNRDNGKTINQCGKHCEIGTVQLHRVVN